jgi:predicted negative regulator of RcsB-dependent stress response
LAIHDFNLFKETGEAEHFERAVGRLKEAYALDNTHSVTCLHLARLLLIKKEYDKVYNICHFVDRGN